MPCYDAAVHGLRRVWGSLLGEPLALVLRAVRVSLRAWPAPSWVCGAGSADSAVEPCQLHLPRVRFRVAMRCGRCAHVGPEPVSTPLPRPAFPDVPIRPVLSRSLDSCRKAPVHGSARNGRCFC